MGLIIATSTVVLHYSSWPAECTCVWLAALPAAVWLFLSDSVFFTFMSASDLKSLNGSWYSIEIDIKNIVILCKNQCLLFIFKNPESSEQWKLRIEQNSHIDFMFLIDIDIWYWYH